MNIIPPYTKWFSGFTIPGVPSPVTPTVASGLTVPFPSVVKPTKRKRVTSRMRGSAGGTRHRDLIAAPNDKRGTTSVVNRSYAYNALNRPVRFENEAAGIVITADYDKAPGGCKGDWTNLKGLPRRGEGAMGCARVNMGRRVFKKVETNNTVTSHLRFLYRGYLQVAALDLTRAMQNAMWLITWDPTEPVATRPLAIQQSGTWYTYGLDLPMNVTELYGTNGYIVTAYTYSPYGLVIAAGNVSQHIQWSSEFSDTDLGLVYYNYRHYNPLDGRWTGRDALSRIRQANDYAYTDNVPLAKIDRLGLYAPGWEGAQAATNWGSSYGQGNVTYGMNKAPQKQNGCRISICCKRAGVVFSRGHCVIRIVFSTGSPLGCRGGPSRFQSGNISGFSGGSSNSAAGSSDSSSDSPLANVGSSSNAQDSECTGCCGSWGNVSAGCNSEAEDNNNSLQKGINSDLIDARKNPDHCEAITTTSDQDCQAKLNCLRKEMENITRKCYIYKPLGNNSNTTWKTAFKKCFGYEYDPAGFQPGNSTFDERKTCK